MSIIKLLITKFWFLLIPLLLFFAWLVYKKKKKKSEFDNRLFLWGVFGLVVLVLIALIYNYYIIQKTEQEFVPTRFDEEGKLIPSELR